MGSDRCDPNPESCSTLWTLEQRAAACVCAARRSVVQRRPVSTASPGLKLTRALRSLVLVWLGWATLMLAFQAFVQARFTLTRPDNALEWSAADTADATHKDRPYLADPFMRGHAA